MPEVQRWLAIDIGNTQTVAGVFELSRLQAGAPFELLKQVRFKTDPALTSDDWLQRLQDLSPSRCTRVLVASVVPAVKTALTHAFSSTQPGWPLLWVDSNTQKRFELKLPHPEQLGADRIANVAGALARYDAPLIIVDAGTATTFCLVDSHRRYIGGAITTGMETSFHALASRAAKLFEVEWTRQISALGNTTESQLQSGIFQAHEALISGLTDQLLRDAGAEFQSAKRILTGGCGHLLSLESAGFEFIPTLTLEGLMRLGLENLSLENIS